MTYRAEFTLATRKAAWARAGGICECGCGLPFDLNHPKGCPEYDHIIPAKLGGDNSLENCLCVRKDHHTAKTAQEDMPRIQKVRREDKRRSGLQARKATLPGSKGSKWKRKVGGGAVPRE